MPLDLGSRGHATKFQLYTVPGQVYYNSTRKLVLQGVDGVIFVADSSRAKLEDNKVSLDNLRENLAEMGKEFGKFPIVFQWNKRDMPDAMSPEELAKELNVVGAPAFEGVASRGEGVFQTLKALSKIVLASINSTDGGMSQAADGPRAAPAPKAAPVAKPSAPPAASAPKSAPTPAPAVAASGGLQIERNNIGSGVKPAAAPAASAAPTAPGAKSEARPSMVAAAKAAPQSGGLAIERNETPPPASPAPPRAAASAPTPAPRSVEAPRVSTTAATEAPRASGSEAAPEMSDLMKKTMSASDARSNARMDDVFRREVKVIGGKLGQAPGATSNKNSAVIAVIAVVAVALGAALAFFFLK
jgi:signal recognition particle receptor subunit beta